MASFMANIVSAQRQSAKVAAFAPMVKTPSQPQSFFAQPAATTSQAGVVPSAVLGDALPSQNSVVSPSPIAVTAADVSQAPLNAGTMPRQPIPRAHRATHERVITPGVARVLSTYSSLDAVIAEMEILKRASNLLARGMVNGNPPNYGAVAKAMGMRPPNPAAEVTGAFPGTEAPAQVINNAQGYMIGSDGDPQQRMAEKIAAAQPVLRGAQTDSLPVNATANGGKHAIGYIVASTEDEVIPGNVEITTDRVCDLDGDTTYEAPGGIGPLPPYENEISAAELSLPEAIDVTEEKQTYASARGRSMFASAKTASAPKPRAKATRK